MEKNARKILSQVLVFVMILSLVATSNAGVVYAESENKSVGSERALVEAFVGRLYSLVLGRDGEAGGIKDWADVLLSKESSGVDAGYGFVFSGECIDRNLSDAAYVEMLYRTFMDREPDAGGRDAWVSQLESGVEREQVLFGFIMSDEFRGICDTYGIEVGDVNNVEPFAEALAHYRNQNADITAFVARCYTEALGRAYDPVGLEGWCRVIITEENTPTEAAWSFIFSQEFIDKNLSNEEYVKVLYRTFMGREADGGGLQAWVNTLETGMEDRESIVMGFANSIEFAKILYSFGLGDPVIEEGYNPGQAVAGEVQTGVYIIRSADDPNYALTVVEDMTAEGGYNLVMSELDGGNNQKFLVANEGTHYCLMSMAYYDVNGNSADGKWFMNSTNGGWGTPEKTDNLQVTSNSIGGAKTWKITETEAGTYMIQVIRGDDFKFYVTAEGTISEGSNAGMAEQKDGANQKFTFVHPYTQSLADGTYAIAPLQDNSTRVAMKNASVKDNETVVTAVRTDGTEQLFHIKCVDTEKGLYTIQNANSQRYLYMKGSINIGDPIYQVSYTGAADQMWYVQKNADGTYCFISSNSGQYVTYGLNDGNVAVGAELSQTVGNDGLTQKFMLTENVVSEEVLATGAYEIANRLYRVSSLGNGIYNIQMVAGDKYVAAGADGISYVDEDASAATKWRITQSGDKYVIQSVLTEKYMTEDSELSNSESLIGVVDRTNEVSYEERYDLSKIFALESYTDVQIIERAKTLGLDFDELLYAPSNMKTLETEIENSVLTGLPTESVEFTGNTVKELNTFLRENKGKIVKLTQNINVFVSDENGGEGIVLIPSDTILDGNGYSLVASEGAEIPKQGIMLYYFNEEWNQTFSGNCGVRNLKSEIPYLENTMNLCGADNVLVENNEFSNSGTAIVIADRDNNNDPTNNAIIRNNVFANTGLDTIGVYGDNSRIIISGNEVKNSGEYGIMLSALRDGVQTRVDQLTWGPHDIIVKDNVVSGSTDCAVYGLAAYRCYITGNTLCDSMLEGICLDSGSIGCYFANNHVYGNSRNGGLPGVSIDNSIWNIIDGNNIHDNACNGIKLVRTALGNVIVNNTCVNNSFSTGGNTCAGISMEAVEVEEGNLGYLDGFGSDYNVVINNLVGQGHDFGIMVSNDSVTGRCIGNIVKYNTVTGGYQHSTVDFSSVDNVVKDNIIE